MLGASLASGLYAASYYRARYYDPANGRFFSDDPVGLAGTMTHYTHLRNPAARKAARAIARRVSSPELGKLWPNFVGKFVGKSAETSAGVG